MILQICTLALLFFASAVHFAQLLPAQSSASGFAVVELFTSES